MLLMLGATIDRKDKKGNTALHVASRGGHQEVVKHLLDAKDDDGNSLITDVNELNVYGDTALMWACEYGHKEVARLLLERGASVDLKDQYGLTALIGASVHALAEVVELLLNNNADPDLQDNDGNTALMWAVMEAVKIPAVKIPASWEGDMDPNLKESREGHIEVMKMLLKRRA